ncbi:hypothetical protein ACFE04_016007 [Oxalis oulophora]
MTANPLLLKSLSPFNLDSIVNKSKEDWMKLSKSERGILAWIGWSRIIGIFVKGSWFETHFHLFITDGLHAWLCKASEEEVSDRALQWDLPVSEYIELGERYLGYQLPDSVYGFSDAAGGDGHKRLSWTFEREGMKLEWRWKCEPATDCKQTTALVLDFLMDANVKLSEEVVRKTQSFERLKVEAEKCLLQSEMLADEKTEFEAAVYAKFLGVLNSKKAKLRELRDKLSKQGTAGMLDQEEEDESTDKTESFDDESDYEKPKKEIEESGTSTSKNVPRLATARGRGRKRTAHS